MKTKSNRKLGRGLSKKKITLGPATGGMDALINSINRNTTGGNAGELIVVDISNIRPNPYQPRKEFSDEQLHELAESIKQNGIIQPITIRRKGKRYELIAGERRLRAAALANLNTIPAIVRSISDQDAALYALVENIQRQDLSPIEEAKGFKQLIETHHATHENIASLVGKSRAAISNSIRLLSLDQEVIQLIEEKRLDSSHARTLIPLSNKQQVALAKEIVEKKLSAREAEKLAKQTNTSSPQVKTQNETTRIERTLSKHLGTEVSIQHNSNFKGKIIFSFSSNETFLALLSKLKLRNII